MTGRLRGIKVISFDADGTLFDFDKVMRHSLGHALAELAGRYPAEAHLLDIPTMIAIRERVSEQRKTLGGSLETVRLEAFRQTLRYVQIEDDPFAAHLNAIYLAHRYADIELYDDVREAVGELRPRYRLGLLSNGNSDPERCGLPATFAFTVFAEHHGVEKPDIRLFQIAASRAACSPAEILHVGDSLTTDVSGAQQAGMVAVWLNRAGVPNASTVTPDVEIASLRQLTGLLLATEQGTH